MAQLKEKLLVPSQRPTLVRDCAKLIDEEVERKSGLSGLAIKAAFKTVRAIKPAFIESVIDALLDEWVEKLEGFHGKWQEAGAQGSFGAYCSRDVAGVAEKLLEVTDARAHKADRTVASLYNRLRPNAKEHVIAAVPGLGRVVDKNMAA
ncbi:MAG: hypothetical protein HY902_13190 [Deltaproteobacteria bacterium]|nr:hypothetical protein [Deltaproteobacteria bacterium]